VIDGILNSFHSSVTFTADVKLGFSTELARFRFSLRCFVFAAFAMLSMPVLGQSAAISSSATVTFTLDFPNSNPEHYTITVDAAGHGRYESNGKVVDDSAEENYQSQFEVSPAARDRIFQWAKQAGYFAGQIDSGNKKLAFTGDKLLSYRDGAKSNTAHYNYSNLESVRELTTLFQSMAATLEYGHRLDYFHHYQKLALDDELKRMEAQAKSNELGEIQVAAPVLRSIIDDNSVINVDRARAQRLLEMSNQGGRH
jgi:hypothetical protein